jgi:hypothetical protein
LILIMSFSSKKSSVDDRIRLAHALGFSDYPTNTTAVPYLNYILEQYAGSETMEDYIGLFIQVLEHFRTGASANATPTVHTVQTLVDKFALSGFRDVFADTVAGDPRRKEHVEDTVMCIIGTWTTMLSSFQHKNRSRKVVAAYGIFADATTSQAAMPTALPVTQPPPNSVTIAPYDESVAGLIAGSGLLPGGQWDHRISIESDATTKLIALMLNATNCPNRTLLQNLLGPTSGRAPPSRTTCTQCLME